jgi:hypothetical protein
MDNGFLDCEVSYENLGVGCHPALMAAWFGRHAHGKRVGRHNYKRWQEDLTARK